MNITIGLDPNIFSLGPIQLGWHGLFSALAIWAGINLGTIRAARFGLPGAAVGPVALWGIAGGVIGARLFHVLDHLTVYALDPLSIFAVWQGGIAVYGGFVGGLLAGWLAARHHGLPCWRLADVAGPAMLVGQAIGRLGCLVNGDAWGGPCTCGLSVTYTHDGAALPSNLHNVPTHPYPLYEIAAVALLLLILHLGRRRLECPGRTFLASVLGYGLIRFTLSFTRQEPVILLGLQEAQVIALITAGLAIIGLFTQRKAAATAAS